MAGGNEAGHPLLRRAFAVVMALILLVVLGRVVVEAFSFISENASKPASISGESYTISGEGCGVEKDAADCCQEACISWCAAKNQTAAKAGVVNTAKTKCECACF